MIDNEGTFTGFLAADPYDFHNPKRTTAAVTIYSKDEPSYPISFTVFGKTAENLLKQGRKSRLVTIKFMQANNQGKDGKWYNNLTLVRYHWINSNNWEGKDQKPAQDTKTQSAPAQNAQAPAPRPSDDPLGIADKMHNNMQQDTTKLVEQYQDSNLSDLI